MDDSARRSAAGSLAAVGAGALVAWAGSVGSATAGSIPVFALCPALAFAVNWLAFVPANAARTEKYYDITGTATYLTMTLTAVAFSGRIDARAWIAAVMVVAWTLRLGMFLFRRIRREGRDTRFDQIKIDPMRFLMAWTLQGLWVLFTAAAALAIITAEERKGLGWVAFVGIAVWLAGFAIEVVADRQKAGFRQNPANEGRFIDTGLWAWSRHPNYFGESMLWTGIAIIAVPILSGWRWVVLVSPVFVTLLLTRGSGIPLLERRADNRWGDEEAYQRYKERTPVLVPRPPRHQGS